MSIVDRSKFEELKATGRLPSPKGVALAVMQLAQKEDATQTEIARTIKADPALSGRLVKAANCAALAGRRPVASVPDAVAALGLATVRNLALGFSLVAGYRGGGCPRFDYPGFWSHALATALGMQAIAVRTRVAPAEDAFLLGLLARIGCLGLATVYPAEYAEVLEQHDRRGHRELAALEQQRFAMDHNALTVVLMEDWGLPRVLIDPVPFHECPEDARFPEGSRARALAHSLGLAVRIADLCLEKPEAQGALLPALVLAGARAGQDADALAAIVDQAAMDWREWGPMLEVPTLQVRPIAAIAAATKVESAALTVSAPADTSRPTRAATERARPEPAPLRVLVVDDDRGILLLLKRLLAAEGYEVHAASNGREAMRVALETRPHIIVTDWIMPVVDGLKFCRALRGTSLGRSAYMLLLTSVEDEARLVEAFEAGVDDYILKPINPRVLTARLRAGRRVVELQHEVESDREEIRRFAAELATTNRRLQQAALMDPLTEVPNRRYAMDRMQQEWAAADRHARPLACMLIDVDHFKAINDNHGHDVGDVVLRRVAETLKTTARTQDVICRLGGEEFLVVCPDTDLRAAGQCAERLRAAVNALRVSTGNVVVQVTISLGVAGMEADMCGPEAMIKAADRAVYAAKEAGRNRICLNRSTPPVAAGFGAQAASA